MARGSGGAFFRHMGLYASDGNLPTADSFHSPEAQQAEGAALSQLVLSGGGGDTRAAVLEYLDTTNSAIDGPAVAPPVLELMAPWGPSAAPSSSVMAADGAVRVGSASTAVVPASAHASPPSPATPPVAASGAADGMSPSPPPPPPPPTKKQHGFLMSALRSFLLLDGIEEEDEEDEENEVPRADARGGVAATAANASAEVIREFRATATATPLHNTNSSSRGNGASRQGNGGRHWHDTEESPAVPSSYGGRLPVHLQRHVLDLKERQRAAARREEKRQERGERRLRTIMAEYDGGVAPSSSSSNSSSNHDEVKRQRGTTADGVLRESYVLAPVMDTAYVSAIFRRFSGRRRGTDTNHNGARLSAPASDSDGGGSEDSEGGVRLSLSRRERSEEAVWVSRMLDAKAREIERLETAAGRTKTQQPQPQEQQEQKQEAQLAAVTTRDDGEELQVAEETHTPLNTPAPNPFAASAGGDESPGAVTQLLPFVAASHAPLPHHRHNTRFSDSDTEATSTHIDPAAATMDESESNEDDLEKRKRELRAMYAFDTNSPAPRHSPPQLSKAAPVAAIANNKENENGEGSPTLEVFFDEAQWKQSLSGSQS